MVIGHRHSQQVMSLGFTELAEMAPNDCESTRVLFEKTEEREIGKVAVMWRECSEEWWWWRVRLCEA